MNVFNRPVRVGLLGAGGIAPEHADALLLLPDVRMVAVCDLDQARARTLADQYRIPNTYNSFAAMLEQEPLDVVHILTQPQHHLSPALECLRAGVSVYVEKPLALSVADCRQIASEAASRNLAAGVNHQVARLPAMEEIVQAARDRRFGRINHVQVNFCVGPAPVRECGHFMFSTPGALLLEFCPHPFSVIRRLVGKPLEVVALASDPELLDNGREYLRSWQIASVTERGTAQLNFSVGRGTIEFTVWIHGEDATARWDIRRNTLLFHDPSPYPITAGFRDGLANAGRLFTQATHTIVRDHLIKLKLTPASETNPFYGAFTAFYDALRAGRPVPEDAVAGEDVIAFCEGAANNLTIVRREPARRPERN
jgi:predicted dehydrogenase